MSQVKNDASRRRAFVAAWALVVLAGIGVGWIVSLIWKLIGVGVGHAVSVAFTFVVTSIGAHGLELVTSIATVVLAVATVMLCISTIALSRSANVQFNTEGPFITIGLSPEAGLPWMTQEAKAQFLTAQISDYPEQWKTDDQANVNLAPYLGQGQQFVHLFIINRANKALGVAVDIRVKATLFFGASSGAAPHHPFQISRTMAQAALEAGFFSVGRLFNVSGLSGYMISIDEITYKDIFGKKRQAASGGGILNLVPPGSVTVAPRMYKPRKGEFSRGIP